MNRSLSPAAFAFTVFIFVGTILSMSVLTPHERYYRYQALDNGTTRKADWIYERLHFDPTPVDIALIGTSRTGGALSAPIIEARYCAMTGRRIHVANLSVPETGRNLHYVIAREAVRTKAPALTIIELNDYESRKPHRNFIHLADTADVISAPLLLNLNYFSDLLRLPGRQLLLFAETVTGRAPLRQKFDPSVYKGPHLDRTQILEFKDGRRFDRARLVHPDDLDRELAQRSEADAPFYVLPGLLQPLEYRFSRIYLARIEAIIAAADGRVDYAYLPAWRSGPYPQRLADALGGRAPDYDLGAGFTDDAGLWLDAHHLNADGARAASHRLAEALAHRHPALGRPHSCDEPGAEG